MGTAPEGPRARRAASGAFWLAAAAAAALLSARPAPARAEDRPAAREPLTSLEAGPLRRADAVVLARVRSVTPGRGGAPTIARASVERRLLGAAGGEVTVFVGGPKGADAPAERALDPWFTGIGAGAVGGRSVFFLRSSKGGSGWTLEGMFAADDDEGLEKADVLAAEIGLAAEPDPRRGARRRSRTSSRSSRRSAPGAGSTARASWRGSRARSPARSTRRRSRRWSRSTLLRAGRALGARGIRARALGRRARRRRGRRRDRVPARGPRRGRVPRGPAGRPAADRGAAVPARRASGAFPAAPPGPPSSPAAATPLPRPAEALPSPPAAAAPAKASPEAERARAAFASVTGSAARVEALTALERAAGEASHPDLVVALSDPEAPVRERAAVLLADGGATRALPRMLARFEAESDPAVREAIVRAAGMLGDGTTVPWVAARGDDAATFSAACFALARLRTPEAIERLTTWRERAAAAVPRDEATVRLVDYLRGRSFEEAERVAGRPVGPRAASSRAGDAPRGAGAAPEGPGPR